jgi:hypothetical protein
MKSVEERAKYDEYEMKDEYDFSDESIYLYFLLG